MNPDKTNKKRKINARVTALRESGRDDNFTVDSVLQFDDLSDSMRSKLKMAKASGQSKQAIDDLIKLTSVNERMVQPEPTKGFFGGAADFLGIEKLGRRVGYGLAQLDPEHRKRMESLSDEDQEALRTGGVSNRELAGSAANLGLSVVGGGLIGRGLGRVAGGARFLPKALSGNTARTIAAGGGLGYASDVASGLEQGESTPSALTPGLGTAVGLAGGTFPGVVRYFKGAPQRETNRILAKITPDYGDLSASQKKALLQQGRVTPRGLTTSQKVQLTDNEIATASRNADLIDDDPVKTILNIQNRTRDLDGQVEQFLLSNNRPFNKSQLKTKLSNSMSDVLDISGIGDDVSMERAKKKLIDQFVEEIDTKNMHGLWQARKAFDQRIDKAFTGAPSLQKEVKKQLRNAVQDFIASNTPDKTYKTFMRDMSNLYNLSDLAEISAAKQYPGSVIGEKLHGAGRALTVAGGIAGGLGLVHILGRNASGGGND